MGSLDEILGNVLGGQSGDVSQNQGSGIAQAVRNMLNDSGIGGPSRGSCKGAPTEPACRSGNESVEVLGRLTG